MPTRTHPWDCSPARHALWIAATIVSLALCSRCEADGLWLHWDRCGSAGGSHKTFVCDTDAGTDTLVVSILAPWNYPGVVRVDVDMGVCFPEFILPDWWRVHGANPCRPGALRVIAASAGTCAPLWSATDGSSQHITEHPGNNIQNGFRFRVTVSIADSTRARDIVAGQEYELFREVVDHSHTMEEPTCTGCDIGARIVADYLFLARAQGAVFGTSGGAYVTWQDPSTVCHMISPAANRTWGAIKSLYR